MWGWAMKFSLHEPILFAAYTVPQESKWQNLMWSSIPYEKQEEFPQ